MHCFAKCKQLRSSTLRYSPALFVNSQAFSTSLPRHERDGNAHTDQSTEHVSTINTTSSQRRDSSSNKLDKDDAMTRRLQSLSEQNLTGTRAEDVKAAGFSEDLKNNLLERIASSKISARAQFPSAFAASEAPSSAGQGTRSIAAAQPWSGNEGIGDASLRMLDDAHKRIRVSAQKSGPVARPPKRIDTGRPGKSEGGGDKMDGSGTGVRLANARDRSSMYGYLKDESLTPEEKEKMRKELKDRFKPGARTMPTTLQGLSSLANERIEDAIARGQFKNLPSRGKKIERDYAASSPFLDTTEYFMNKIIQKQEIVPPWIERQQELVAAANRFRARLRADWRRHAARMIASAGGDLQNQIDRAERFAAAEALYNPQPKRMVEKLNTVDKEGHMSQISLAGELQPPQPSGPDEQASAVEVNVTPTTNLDVSHRGSAQRTEAASFAGSAGPAFRDPDWERTEQSYHITAISDLNALTRTYNLMAPDLAKKPYFSLDRELKACYADVAPTLPREIKERALGRARDSSVAPSQNQSLLQNFGGRGHVTVRVRDEDRNRQYGFKQFVRDIFGRSEEARG